MDVSSSVPPLSNKTTRNPELVNSRAKLIPAAPAPTIQTSVSRTVPVGTERASINISSLTCAAADNESP